VITQAKLEYEKSVRRGETLELAVRLTRRGCCNQQNKPDYQHVWGDNS